MFLQKTLIFIVIFTILMSIGACSGMIPSAESTPLPDQSTQTPENLPSSISTEKPTPAPTAETPEPASETLNRDDQITYQFQVVFDYGLQRADVRQQITYINHSSVPVIEILLACDPLRTHGVFNLDALAVDGQSKEAEIGAYWLKIALNAPLEQGAKAQIDLIYHLILPLIPPPKGDQKPVIFGYTTLQTNFVDWYPMAVPRDENGAWVLHDPWFYGEYLVYPLADFDLSVQIDNAPAGIVLAASAAPQSTEGHTYTYQHNRARNFVWSLSPSYLSSQDSINGVTVRSYYFPFNQSAGEQVLRDTVSAIRLYSELFGAYPRASLSVVEADFLDGMEYDGFYFLSKGFYNLYDGTPQGYLTTIAVHETAHQWWYSWIANDQAIEPWLDEALCTYSEYLYYERYHPELVEWWWAYRVDFYDPQGMINQPIYDYHGFVHYRNATYLQGARFLNELRQRSGDAIFFSFIQAYVIQNADSISSSLDFWQVLEQTTGQSFDDLKSKYFD